MSLTYAHWARIERLLPDRTLKRGGRWRDHRQVIDAIAFKYRTGTPWMDLPEHFGSWKGAHNRLRKWAADGTWEKVFTALRAHPDPRLQQYTRSVAARLPIQIEAISAGRRVVRAEGAGG
ncbi:transposase [Streptomyces sp. NPDC059989]|uniref:transposase n=1 Tax=Streptomyces sp. NPDC059989 TaxID=3347026 RepID=UPI0036766DF8